MEDSSCELPALFVCLDEQLEKNLPKYRQNIEPSFEWLREKLEEAKILFQKKDQEFVVPSTPARRRRKRGAATRPTVPVIAETGEVVRTDADPQNALEVNKTGDKSNCEPAVRRSSRRQTTRSSVCNSGIINSTDSLEQPTAKKRRSRASTRHQHPIFVENVRRSTRASARQSSRKLSTLQSIKQNNLSQESEHDTSSQEDVAVTENVRQSTRASARQSTRKLSVLQSIKQDSLSQESEYDTTSQDDVAVSETTVNHDVEKQRSKDFTSHTEPDTVENVRRTTRASVIQLQSMKRSESQQSENSSDNQDDNVVTEDTQASRGTFVLNGDEVRETLPINVTQTLNKSSPEAQNRGTFMLPEKSDARGTFVVPCENNQTLGEVSPSAQNGDCIETIPHSPPNDEIVPTTPSPTKNSNNTLLKAATHKSRITRPIISTPGKSPCVKQYIYAFENLRSPMTDVSIHPTPPQLVKSKLKQTMEKYISNCTVVLSPIKPSPMNTCAPLKSGGKAPNDEDVAETPQKISRKSNARIRQSGRRKLQEAEMLSTNDCQNKKIKEEKTVTRNTKNNSVIVLDETHDEEFVMVTPSPKKKTLKKRKLVASQSCTTLSKPKGGHISRISHSAQKNGYTSESGSSSSKKRFTRSITTAREQAEAKKKMETYLLKERQAEEKRKKKQEMIQQKTKDAKKKREAKFHKVQALKKAREEEVMKMKLELENHQLDLNRKEKEREEKLKEEMLKKQLKTKMKLEEAEARRKFEEEARLAKLREQEDIQKQQENKQLRKREREEQERQQKLIENRRLQEERALQAQKERTRVLEKQRLEMLKREEQIKQKKIESEKSKTIERITREKMELERIQQRDKQIREQWEKERELERQAKILKEKQKQDALRSEAIINAAVKKQNASVLQQQRSATSQDHVLESNTVNVTFNKENEAEHYEMTPPRPKEIVKSKNDDNYDINNLNSGDETDDESAPRKKVPEWARGYKLKASLIQQDYQPIDTYKLFGPIEPPNLSLIFTHQRPRFFKRTSSAIWDSPALKH